MEGQHRLEENCILVHAPVEVLCITSPPFSLVPGPGCNNHRIDLVLRSRLVAGFRLYTVSKVTEFCKQWI